MWLFSRKYFPFFEEGAGYLQRESCTSLDLRIPGAVFRAVSLSLRPAQFELVYGAVHSDWCGAVWGGPAGRWQHWRPAQRSQLSDWGECGCGAIYLLKEIPLQPYYFDFSAYKLRSVTLKMQFNFTDITFCFQTFIRNLISNAEQFLHWARLPKYLFSWVVTQKIWCLEPLLPRSSATEQIPSSGCNVVRWPNSKARGFNQLMFCLFRCRNFYAPW